MVQAPWLPGASSQPIAPVRSSVYWLASLACSLLSSRPLSSNCTAQHVAQNPGWLHYCERIHTISVSFTGCRWVLQFTWLFGYRLTIRWCCQSKYRWVSGPLSPCLCQRSLLPAAAGRTQHTDEALQKDKAEKQSKREKIIGETPHLLDISTAFIQLHHLKTHFQLQNRITCNL